MVGIEANSPTLLVWALFSTGPGLGEGIGVLTGAPYVVAKVKAMASAIMFALSKKPSMGMPMATQTSSVVG